VVGAGVELPPQPEIEARLSANRPQKAIARAKRRRRSGTMQRTRARNAAPERRWPSDADPVWEGSTCAVVEPMVMVVVPVPPEARVTLVGLAEQVGG